MSRFVDRVVLHLQAGDSGHGYNPVLCEKFKLFGDPDSGDGGHGGDVVSVVDPQIHTLMDFHFHPHIKAANSKPGTNDYRNGAHGEDLVLGVPEGTVVMTEDGEVPADMIGKDARFTVAEGGYGGLGDTVLVSKNRRAPGFAFLDEPGEAKGLVLELKFTVDVRLVGFPSAGEFSLVNTSNVAKPKIGDYPLTALQPNLGVVNVSYESFTIAGMPGLVLGASESHGLGLDFPRHIERCVVLVRMADVAALERDRDPVSDVQTLEAELTNYQSVLETNVGLGDLTGHSRVIVLNRIDLLDARKMIDMQCEELEKFGWSVYEIFMVMHEGLKELTYSLRDQTATYHEAHPLPIEQEPRAVVHPEGMRGKKREGAEDFTIERDPNTPDEFIVHSYKLECWISQTGFENDEAVGYLINRLTKPGAEDALAKAGARVGCLVMISYLTSERYPQQVAGINDFVPSGRDTNDRPYINECTSVEQCKRTPQARRGLIDEYDFGDDEEVIRDWYSQALAPTSSASEDLELIFYY